MGDLRPDNGGNWPPDDGGASRDGLPDLPAEWGTVVIPDDPAELAEEAAQIRRQLRRTSRRNLVRRVFGMSPLPIETRTEGHGFAVPILIMTIAIMTTLASLYVVTWDHRQSPTDVMGATGTGHPATPLADLSFTNGAGEQVRIGSLLPAVIILTDSCLCVDLILKTAAALPKGTTVLAVGVTPPLLSAAPSNVQTIADPDGVIRTRYAANATPIADKATVLLIDEAHTITTIPAATSVQEITSRLTTPLPTTPLPTTPLPTGHSGNSS